MHTTLEKGDPKPTYQVLKGDRMKRTVILIKILFLSL